MTFCLSSLPPQGFDVHLSVCSSLSSVSCPGAPNPTFCQRAIFCIPTPACCTEGSNKVPQAFPEGGNTGLVTAPTLLPQNCVTRPPASCHPAPGPWARTLPPRAARTASMPIGCRPRQPGTLCARGASRGYLKAAAALRPLSSHSTLTEKHLG